MKRHDLIRQLESHGCSLLRDRGSHSIYVNPLAPASNNLLEHSSSPPANSRSNVCFA
jgi:predicted RNA binding protein YcfA (HicA-like mRNA interferase family)